MTARGIGLAAGALLAAYLLWWPTAIDPVAWQPLADPGLSGPYASNQALGSLHLLPEVGPGPEAVAVSRDGWLYTGLQDGRVVRMQADGGTPATFARTGGRPLGMKFDRAGNLIVADAFRGLLRIDPHGTIVVLADRAAGEPIRFANDLAIGNDGAICFSDSSRRFDQLHWMADFWEARPTGRLLRYDPAGPTVSVVLDGLMFPNGVALGPGDEFVVVAETLPARLTRHWLRGPKAGQSEQFGPPLPGYPDNVTYDGKGIFWIALPSPRVPALERMAGWPRLRQVLFHIPAAIRDPQPGRLAWVLGMNTEGRVVRSLQDSSGKYGEVTSVIASASRLYFGSIATRAIGWVDLPD